MNTLILFALIKKKYSHGNQMSFMTKDLSVELMTRLRLRNKCLKQSGRKSSHI